ncbi:hypothetical protein GCM10011351_28130 [Paraliobacillus quinghaiensis]|uniref:DUF4367 domain-containing protein n=1 Tax=Paraliobacillus quinghaiensis TaxID=470815 RepID=A0A917TVJ0_9BACI|nr:hypothetical protein [Paraliobacillus quinghaiensis]GGM40354.1 hypothetical protein GCM10011351_28130 [Paraliobacillus quinghaiensis]
MDDKKIEKDIRKSLIANTNKVSNKKEQIWNNIEARMNITEKARNEVGEKPGKKDVSRRRRQKNTGKSKQWVMGILAATILFGVFLINTDTGQAVVTNITEYFAPEKKVIDEVEGISEEKEVTLQESKAGYNIYIDEERYILIEENGVDKIVPKEPLGDQYPEVSMTISQVEDIEPEQLAKEIHKQLNDSYENVQSVTTVDQPFEAIVVSALDGDDWDSPVNKTYIISNQKKGSFVISEKYFLEAEEGHGARFYNMLKEFNVVEISK